MSESLKSMAHHFPVTSIMKLPCVMSINVTPFLESVEYRLFNSSHSYRSSDSSGCVPSIYVIHMVNSSLSTLMILGDKPRLDAIVNPLTSRLNSTRFKHCLVNILSRLTNVVNRCDLVVSNYNVGYSECQVYDQREN